MSFKNICLSAATGNSSAPSARISQSLFWTWPNINLHEKSDASYLRMISQYEQEKNSTANINWHTSQDFSEA